MKSNCCNADVCHDLVHREIAGGGNICSKCKKPCSIVVPAKLKKWQYDEIRWAYENRVPEAIPEMVKHDKEWKWEEIRLAYEKGVPEAVKEMVEHDEYWQWQEVRWAYEEKRRERLPKYNPELTIEEFVKSLK